MNVQQLTADQEFYSCELSWKCFAFSYFSDVVDTTSNDCPRMPRLSGNALIKRLNDSSPEKLNVTQLQGKGFGQRSAVTTEIFNHILTQSST